MSHGRCGPLVPRARRLSRSGCSSARPLLLASLLLLGVVPGMRAQSRPVTDAEVQRILPVLRAEAAGLRRGQQLVSEMGREAGGDGRFGERVRSGELEPLAWLRGISAQAVAPPGVRYGAACSREAPVGGYAFRGEGGLHESHWLTAVAVFSLGLPAAPKGAPAGDGRQQAIRAAVRGAASFYLRRGFTDLGGENGYRYLLSPDGAVLASVEPDNFWGHGPDPLPGCRELPNGPVLMLRRVRLGADEDAPEEALARALTRAGLEEAEYRAIFSSLATARAARRHPEVLEILPGPVVPANVEVYERNAAQLEPLFTALLAGLEK